MSGSPAVVLRLVASAYTVAERAGQIVRKVLHSGELGIVEKVMATRTCELCSEISRQARLGFIVFICFLYVPIHRPGQMICRHWQTD